MTGLTREQGYELGDDCLHRFSHYIEMAWQLQPSSLEAKELFFAKYRPSIVACIRDNGGTVRDDATRDETLIASFLVEENTGVDCFAKAGLSPG